MDFKIGRQIIISHKNGNILLQRGSNMWTVWTCDSGKWSFVGFYNLYQHVVLHVISCWLCWYFSMIQLLIQLAGVAWKRLIFHHIAVVSIIYLSLRKPFNFEPNRIETVVKLFVMYMRIMIAMNRGIPETNFRSLLLQYILFLSSHILSIVVFLSRFDFMLRLGPFSTRWISSERKKTTFDRKMQ